MLCESSKITNHGSTNNNNSKKLNAISVGNGTVESNTLKLFVFRWPEKATNLLINSITKLT